MVLNWTPNPSDPEVFHITHVDNLPSIEQSGLLSDARVAAMGTAPTTIGDSTIKSRRLTWWLRLPDRPVVGSFVPFYFCPRSVMLYRVWRQAARPVQDGVVHLVSRVSTLARLGRRCVFTDVNAAASYASAFEDLGQISDTLDWTALTVTDWRDPAIKSARQAEFLVADAVPWTAFEAAVVMDLGTLQHAQAILARCQHPPLVRIERSWYYP